MGELFLKRQNSVSKDWKILSRQLPSGRINGEWAGGPLCSLGNGPSHTAEGAGRNACGEAPRPDRAGIFTLLWVPWGRQCSRLLYPWNWGFRSTFILHSRLGLSKCQREFLVHSPACPSARVLPSLGKSPFTSLAAQIKRIMVVFAFCLFLTAQHQSVSLCCWHYP